MKPFTDAEFIKECTLAIVNKVCPKKKLLFDSIPLLPEQLLSKQQNFQNKSNQNNFQNLLSKHFDVIEEFAELILMKVLHEERT